MRYETTSVRRQPNLTFLFKRRYAHARIVFLHTQIWTSRLALAARDAVGDMGHSRLSPRARVRGFLQKDRPDIAHGKRV